MLAGSAPIAVELATPLTLGRFTVDIAGGNVTMRGATLRVEGPTTLRGAPGSRLRFVGDGVFSLDLLAGDADLILVMRDGDIVEQGTHDELIQKNGYYAELYNSQFEVAIA